MKILALLTPASGRTLDEFRPHVVVEEAALWPMYRAGLVREMHFQPEPLTVALTFEAAGKPEVEAALARLPMVTAGLFNISSRSAPGCRSRRCSARAWCRLREHPREGLGHSCRFDRGCEFSDNRRLSGLEARWALNRNSGAGSL